MPDKPTATNGGYAAIPGWAVASLRGADAAAFAQAQFMGDVAALAPGHWHWNGWLTPKGRVIALFALLKQADDALLLLLPDADPQALVAALGRFVFRSKVKVSVEPRWQVAGTFAPPRQARGAMFADLGDDGIELDLGADGGARSLCVSALDAPEDPALAQRWIAFDLAHGLPRLDASQGDRWTPQQLSLERLRAYSVKKGCYPGQEIVARTHFLGQAKRGLIRLEGIAAGDGDEVFAGDPPTDTTPPARTIGQIVCAAGGQALAVMPLDAGDGPFATVAGPCTRQPLLDGLAR